MTNLSPERAADLAAAPLARAYLAGDADPVEVTEVYLDRIAAADGSAVYLRVTAERARAEAEAAKARYAAGTPASPLDGVPVAWKDLVDFKGEPTTAASALWRNAAKAQADSPVVANLAGAGLVALGKTNLTEFAYSGLGLNPHFGTPANPYDQTTPRAPGGSSSGSAVAVATGLAAIAIGTDTGGSVRIPAAFNGVVGYKSSEGRIDKSRVVPLSATLDTVGPIARTVEDCILCEAALRGAPPTVRRADPTALTLVVCESVFLDDCEDAVIEGFEAALARLAERGVTIERARIPEVEEAAALTAEHGTLVAAEAYALHRERVDGPEVEEMDGRVVARILKGKAMSAFDVLALQQARRRLIPALAERLGAAYLVGPTVAHVAPAIEPLDADPDEFSTVNLKTLRNTSLGNFLDMPGVAMPMEGPGSLPLSFLLSAVGPRDEALLGAALALEPTIRGTGTERAG